MTTLILLALALLYAILAAVGMLGRVTELARNLFANQSFAIHGGWILARLTMLSLPMVLTLALVNLFMPFLYNLISDVIGPIEVKLTERRGATSTAASTSSTSAWTSTASSTEGLGQIVP